MGDDPNKIPLSETEKSIWPPAPTVLAIPDAPLQRNSVVIAFRWLLGFVCGLLYYLIASYLLASVSVTNFADGSFGYRNGPYFCDLVEFIFGMTLGRYFYKTIKWFALPWILGVTLATVIGVFLYFVLQPFSDVIG